MAEENDL